MAGSFVVGGPPVGTLGVSVVTMFTTTVVVLAGASVFDVPLMGPSVPVLGVVKVLLLCDTTTVAPLPAVEAGPVVLGLLEIAGDEVTRTVVETMAGDVVILTGVCGVCDWLLTAVVGVFVVAGTNTAVVTAALVLVVTSVFTLGAKVCVALGSLIAALLLLVTAGATVVPFAGVTPAASFSGSSVVWVFLVAASLSPPSAEMLLRRKPKEEKRRQDCKQTGTCKSSSSSHSSELDSKLRWPNTNPSATFFCIGLFEDTSVHLKLSELSTPGFLGNMAVDEWE